MKAKIVVDGAPVLGGTGFSAITLATLPSGTEIEILSTKKVDGKKWLYVELANGQVGFLSGNAADRSGSSSWRSDEQRDALRSIGMGAFLIVCGILAIVLIVAMIDSAVRSRGDVSFLFQPFALLAVGAILYGGFRIIGGIVEFIQSFRE